MANGKSHLGFGNFRLDEETGELFDKSGTIIKLQQQPAQVLTFLASRPNVLVTREEIQKMLWSDDTFVDFEQGLNYCIKQIRTALNDDAKTPKFVETLPRRGYRFIAEVKRLGDNLKAEKIENPVFEKTKSILFRRLIYGLTISLILFLGTALVWNFVSSNDASGTFSRNPEAQDAYLKGKHIIEKGDAESIKKSVEFFTQAIHNDEKFASAYVARSDAFYQLGLFGNAKTTDIFPKAKTDAIKALEINKSLADAYTILGSIAFRYDWNFPTAENYFKKAIELNPNASAFHDYAWFLASQSRFEEAINSIEKAQQIDPTSVRTNIDVGWIYARARRYDQAILQMNRTLDLEPNSIAARQCLECAFFNKGMFKESVNNALSLIKQAGASDEDLAKIRAVEPKEAFHLIEKWRLTNLESKAEKTYIPQYILAIQAAATDDKEKAFQYLEKSFQERDAGLVMFKVEQVWDKYRDDVRYQEMLKNIGLNQ